jgi:hypothetical protein
MISYQRTTTLQIQNAEFWGDSSRAIAKLLVTLFAVVLRISKISSYLYSIINLTYQIRGDTVDVHHPPFNYNI